MRGRAANPTAQSIFSSTLARSNRYGPANRRKPVLAQPNFRLDHSSPAGALSTHGRTRPRAQEHTLPLAVDSLANTFAVNGSAGGEAGRCLKLLAPGMARIVRHKRQRAHARSVRIESHRVIRECLRGGLLRGIALAYALHRGDGMQAYAPWGARIITRTGSQTLNP